MQKESIGGKKGEEKREGFARVKPTVDGGGGRKMDSAQEATLLEKCERGGRKKKKYERNAVRGDTNGYL